MRRYRVTVFAVATWLTGSFSLAEVVPGRWEKVEALAEGSELRVAPFGKEAVFCQFRGFEGESLVVTDEKGAYLRIPRVAIDRIETAETVRDSRRNGTLLGAGAGFAAGFFGMAAFNAHATASGPIWDGEAVGYYVSAGILGMGAGAAAGYALDAAVENREVLYQSIPRAN
jgi:hypothetical protein